MLSVKHISSLLAVCNIMSCVLCVPSLLANVHLVTILIP
jgi:hypothetical protein